jgi:hypothetical protein
VEELLKAGFIYLGIPAMLVSPLLIFNRIGAYFDKEAEDDWKEQVRQALKRWRWIDYARAFQAIISNLLDRIFGFKICSLSMFTINLFITIFTSLPLAMALQTYNFIYRFDPRIFVFTFAHLYGETDFPIHYNKPLSYMYSSIILMEISVARLPLAILMDFLTFLRVRYFCRAVVSFKSTIAYTSLAITLDIVTVTILYYLGSLFIRLLWYYGALIGFGKLTSFMETDIDVFTLGRESVINYAAYISAVAAIAPALIFYFYALAALFLRLVTVVSRPVAFISRRLQFKTPFTTIGNVCGLLVSSVMAAIFWLVHHL